MAREEHPPYGGTVRGRRARPRTLHEVRHLLDRKRPGSREKGPVAHQDVACAGSGRREEEEGMGQGESSAALEAAAAAGMTPHLRFEQWGVFI